MLYLIPTFLHEDAIETVPAYVLEAVKKCTVFFVEDEKSARRYLKRLWREMVIDDYKWYTIHKAEEQVMQSFTKHLQAGDTIGIISEAGCPCIADPGQILVNKAQQLGTTIKPLVGPSSILLALMASGMNGQQFQFNGYLPIDNVARKKAIKDLEINAIKNNCTQIFIETPYRNMHVLEALLQGLNDSTSLCVAWDLTLPTQGVVSQPISVWKKSPLPNLQKKTAVFLISV